MKRLLAALTLLLSCLSATAGAEATPRRTVPVQLVSITDLHGYFGDYTTTVPGSHAGAAGCRPGSMHRSRRSPQT